ncbi:hypothetical protein F2P79_000537 [Pimephales promelas]|nr:hypothetical protein F2P79_000537 [Pimephales promelas]
MFFILSNIITITIIREPLTFIHTKRIVDVLHGESACPSCCETLHHHRTLQRSSTHFNSPAKR